MIRFLLLPILFISSNAFADAVSAQGACNNRVEASLLHGTAVGVVDASGSHEVFCGAVKNDHEEFELGSISKTFAGITAAKLALQNRLDIEAPISKYVSELSGTFVGSVSVHLLATHSAQLVRNFPGDTIPSWNYSDVQLIAFLKTYQPDLKVLPAGTRLYSNLSFGTLALVISRVAGKVYAQVVREEILAPLGMTETDFITSTVKSSAMVDGHNLAMQPMAFWGVSDLGVGAGGVMSDLHDMMIYLRANLNPDQTLLGRAMVLSQTLGLGWDSLHGTLPTWKDGLMTDGYATLLKFDPSKQTGVIVLSDTYNLQSTMSIGNIAMGVKDSLVEPPFSAALMAALIGIYENSKSPVEMSVVAVGQTHLNLVINTNGHIHVSRLMALAGQDATFLVNDGQFEDDEVTFAIDPATGQTTLTYLFHAGKAADGKDTFEPTGLLVRKSSAAAPANLK